jgi:hypothetical protein
LKKYGLNFDIVLANSKKFRKGCGDGFVNPVIIDQMENIKHQPVLVAKDLINPRIPLYHDIDKIGKEVWSIILKNKKRK